MEVRPPRRRNRIPDQSSRARPALTGPTSDTHTCGVCVCANPPRQTPRPPSRTRHNQSTPRDWSRPPWFKMEHALGVRGSRRAAHVWWWAGVRPVRVNRHCRSTRQVRRARARPPRGPSCENVRRAGSDREPCETFHAQPRPARALRSRPALQRIIQSRPDSATESCPVRAGLGLLRQREL